MKRILHFAFLLASIHAFGQAPSITFGPLDAATNVSTSNNLTITFSAAVRNINNSAINDSNVDALIELRLTNSSGTLVASDATINAGKTIITIDPSVNLLEEQLYYLSVASVENSADEATALLTAITFTTGDFTNPTVTSANLTANVGTAFTFNVTVDDNATVFYVVTNSGTVPSKAQIEAGQDHSGTALPATQTGAVAVSSGVPFLDAVSGLSASTKYRVHFFVRDGGNNETAVDTRNEPVRNSSSTSAPTGNGFTLSAQYDMDGNTGGAGIKYVVTANSTSPTHTQILAGQNESGTGALANGSFFFNSGATANEVISDTDLLGATLYYVHFFGVNNSGTYSEIFTEDETTTDTAPPAITILSPTDGFLEVDISTNTFTLTFNENIDNINSGASSNTERIRLFENGLVVETIDRDDITLDADGKVEADGTSNNATITFVYSLIPNEDYYILIGEDVFEDNAGNDFAGFLATTDLNFNTSGVTINNATNSICSGSFQSIGNIIISENGVADFNNGTNVTLEIELVNTSNYILSTSGISVAETGSDISSIAVTSVTFSKILITYTVSGGTTKDVITISGLNIFASPSAPATILRRSSGTANQDGNNGAGGSSLTYSQISVGSSPPSSPLLAAAQDLQHCQGETISGKTLTLQSQPGATFKWYAEASLSTLLHTTTATTVNIVSNLAMANPTVAGAYDFYVVAETSCQSTTSLSVNVEVFQRPVADGGTLKTICEGQSIQIGGLPVVSTPTASPYTYLWSGPGTITTISTANPTVTPPNTTLATEDFIYSVVVTDANLCNSVPANATVRVKNVTSPSFTSPIQFTFNENNDPILLQGSPSINSSFSGTAVYNVGVNYYFDPEVATIGTYPITYTTDLPNGCQTSIIQPFTVNNAAGNVFGLASSYCNNEGIDNISYNGSVWKSNIDAFNASSATFDYYFSSFFNYYGDAIGNDGLINTGGGNYNLNPSTFDHPFGSGSFTYIGLRVLRDYVDPFITDDIIIYSYQGFRIFDVTPVSFSGLTSVLPTNTHFCNQNLTYSLTGNFTNNNSTFEISRDNNNFFDGVSVGLINTGNGTATFNPQAAFNSTIFNGTAATGATTFYVRYSYNFPSTTGSTGSPCTNSSTQVITIYPLPTVAFNASPPNNQEFCFDALNQIILGTTNGANLQFSGYGIGTTSFTAPTGQSNFDPDVAFGAKEFADNTSYTTPQSITITAQATSGQGCTNSTTRDLIVRPLPPATFASTPRLLYCNEDVSFLIDGAQTNASYNIVYRGTTTPINFSPPTINSPDMSFTAKTYFDDAVSRGANPSIDQIFDVTYITSDVSGCTNNAIITLTVDPALILDIGGMESGDVFCENGGVLNLAGNNPGSGKFQSRTSFSSFADSGNGLNNGSLPVGNGLATLNLALAYDVSDVGNDGGLEDFYVRYVYRGPGCTGDAEHIESIQILPPPALSFVLPTPADNTAFCYDQSATPAAVAIVTNTPANSTITLTGFGIVDNGSGSGTFNATVAFQQTELALSTTLTTDQIIQITAQATDDTYGCVTVIPKPLVARVLPPASFTYGPPVGGKTEYCFEDTDQLLDGQQLNAKYDIIFRNTTSPTNYTVTNNSADISFDPSFYFSESVARGANELATLEFDVLYTATAPTTCTHRLSPITFKISPRIPVDIAGVENSDIFCSNLGDRILNFSPPDGTFRINGGSPEPIPDAKYNFDPPLIGPASGTNYTFSYTVITGSSCTNTTIKSINVLPSPRAFFTLEPQCENELIDYTANGTGNLANANYTWTFIDSVRTGQTLPHRFPGASTFSVQLNVEHPAFAGNPTLVCKDSLRLDQIVGPYPKVDFKFTKVCEDEDAEFDVDSDIPISQVSWEFGDATIIPFGLLSNTITSSATTSGIFERPVHNFPNASTLPYSVILIGKTANNFGSCADTIVREVTILKKLSPTPVDPYYMVSLDSERGFWKVEDRADSSTWEFGAPSGVKIVSPLTAWVTNADGPYLGQDNSFVNSPCFDLSAFQRPVLSIQHWSDTEGSDGSTLQYSVDGGNQWIRLGNIGSGLEWYNRLTVSSNPGGQSGVTTGWSADNQNDWLEGKHTLDVNVSGSVLTQYPRVRFRVAFASFNNATQKDGFAFRNVKIEERNRTLLVENFTNLSDKAVTQENTLNNNASFRGFNSAASTDELVKIQYHTSISGLDENNDVNPIDNAARAAFYGVTQTAKGFIDGYSSGRFDGANWITNEFSLRSLVSSLVKVTVTSPDLSNNQFNVQVVVENLEAIPPGQQYVVQIAVVEKDVNGEAYVLRKLLPTASGTPLTISAIGEEQTVIASYDLRHVLNQGQLAVVAFVQCLQSDPATGRKNVLQARFLDTGSLTIPTDIITGAEQLDFAFEVYPNPADEKLTINLPQAVTKASALQVYDQMGKVVSETRFEKGEQTKQLPTNKLSDGVYLMKIETAKGMLMRKVMVVHQ